MPIKAPLARVLALLIVVDAASDSRPELVLHVPPQFGALAGSVILLLIAICRNFSIVSPSNGALMLNTMPDWQCPRWLQNPYIGLVSLTLTSKKGKSEEEVVDTGRLEK